MVYGCDPAWWKYRQGLKQFAGTRIAWSGAQVEDPDILTVDIPLEGRAYSTRMAFDKIGTIGGGGNSGFQALNLAVQFGARRIILVGFDMNDRAGKHWYGRNTWAGANNPDESNFRRWLAAFEGAGVDLKARGVEVINASPHSDIRAFPKASIAEALKAWGC